MWSASTPPRSASSSALGARLRWAPRACRRSTGSAAGIQITAKVRSLAKPVPAALDDDRILFPQGEYGVSPGQAAVLYSGDRVLGGGWIEETEPSAIAVAA